MWNKAYCKLVWQENIHCFFFTLQVTEIWKNYFLTAFLEGRFSFAKGSSGYPHCFSASQNKRSFEEPEVCHAQGKANVCLARSSESCISWHPRQTETPPLAFGAMAGQICQGGRAWTAEINEFTSFGDVCLTCLPNTRLVAYRLPGTGFKGQ